MNDHVSLAPYQASMRWKYQKNSVLDILKLSNCSLYQDVTLLCSDGSEKMSSFLLASVFPLFRDVLSDVAHYEKEIVINLPDVVRSEIKNFFDDLLKVKFIIFPGDTIKFLLQNLNNNSSERKEDVEHETKVESHDWEVEDADVDFADLDPLFDDIKADTDTKKHPLKPKDQIRGGRKPKWKCTFEGCTFTCNKSRMEGHLKCHEKEANLSKGNVKKRKCLIEGCDFQATINSNQMMHHLQTMHSDLNPKCNQCGEEFPTFGDVLRHIRKAHPEPVKKYICEMCGYTSSRPRNLERHKETIHYYQEMVDCDRCNKKFKKIHFSKHKCFREVPLAKEMCTICGKSVVNLKNHIEFVHEGKMVECPICHRSVKALKAHMLTHEQMQCCPTCGISVRSLKLHMKRVHTADEKKKFQCQDCEKGFDLKQCLEKHRINVHLKTYPYQCRYGCDVKYNDTSNRNSHEKKKHGELFERFK